MQVYIICVYTLQCHSITAKWLDTSEKRNSILILSSVELNIILLAGNHQHQSSP
jgi:hypothetical protein